MNTASHTTRRQGSAYELHFQSLFHPGRALAFPCDAAGEVDFDAMSERMRDSYRRARQAIGRDYSMPIVAPRQLH